MTEEHRADRRFGQNFLTDGQAAAALVRRFEIAPGERIVEIGPGTGALTRHIAPLATRLVALELDRRLIDDLAALLAPFPAAEVRPADALTVDWEALAAELGGPLRVIGNLPYNVGTPIVRRLIASPAVADMQFVLQLEVVERFLAAPRTKAYGPLTVIAALRATARRAMTLPPHVFKPRPKVTSAALRLTPLADPPLAAPAIEPLEELLFTGFGHRRKTLAGNFGERGPAVRAFLAARGLAEMARAEELSPGQWLDLARHLGAGV